MLSGSATSETPLWPPSIKRKIFERIALKIREIAAVPLDRPLDPWRLAPQVKLQVVDIGQLQGLSAEARAILLKDKEKDWSGATTMPLPNGWRLVFINPKHSKERQAATLMEEVSHIILGHTPTVITPDQVDDNMRLRDFHKAQEEAAYSVGAAALVPYGFLHTAVTRGIAAERIARRFQVSEDLALYRIKVCHLWEMYLHYYPPAKEKIDKKKK